MIGTRERGESGAGTRKRLLILTRSLPLFLYLPSVLTTDLTGPFPRCLSLLPSPRLRPPQRRNKDPRPKNDESIFHRSTFNSHSPHPYCSSLRPSLILFISPTAPIFSLRRLLVLISFISLSTLMLTPRICQWFLGPALSPH